MTVRLSVDFGGTKIEAAALSPEGAFLARRRRPNPGAYAPVVACVRELVEDLIREFGPAASVGIGIPGSISPGHRPDPQRQLHLAERPSAAG